MSGKARAVALALLAFMYPAGYIVAGNYAGPVFLGLWCLTVSAFRK